MGVHRISTTAVSPSSNPGAVVVVVVVFFFFFFFSFFALRAHKARVFVFNVFAETNTENYRAENTYV